jgi:FKBP-type peptidyl-prolyl cis-trans isomerase SlyD
MTFVFGVETQIRTLEKAIEGKRVGDAMSLIVPPSEIYGEHDPALIVEIPKKGLIKQRLKEGQFYRQMKMGSLVSFKVLEIRPATVLVDFNKPLTGIQVGMDIEILGVREASADEIRAAAEAQAKRTIGCG